jgi:hypothetical protein
MYQGMGKSEMDTEQCLENLMGRDYFGDSSVHVKIILKWIIENGV